MLVVQGYPLRPELMESTYLMYCATRDPALLQVCTCTLILLLALPIFSWLYLCHGTKVFK